MRFGFDSYRGIPLDEIPIASLLVAVSLMPPCPDDADSVNSVVGGFTENDYWIAYVGVGGMARQLGIAPTWEDAICRAAFTFAHRPAWVRMGKPNWNNCSVHMTWAEFVRDARRRWRL